jgi:hypothetical protein
MEEGGVAGEERETTKLGKKNHPLWPPLGPLFIDFFLDLFRKNFDFFGLFLIIFDKAHGEDDFFWKILA